MKSRLSVYLEPALMAQLTTLADRKKQSMSLVAEAAIASFLTPDEDDRREAAVVRRLDRLTRQVERLERDLAVSVEATALFIRYWLMITPSVPNDFQAVAQAKGSKASGYDQLSLFGEAFERIRRGDWGRPRMVALECGGINSFWEVVVDKAVLREQVPRLYSLVKKGELLSIAEP